MDQIFECVVHHARDFSSFMDPDYVGPVETLDCDPNFFSYFALLSTLKNCGYVSLKSLWYHDPTMEDEFIPLNNDSGCRRMRSIALQYDRVHLYVVHPMSQPDVVALEPLLEYPCMAPPVPPVVNETNEGPTDVGPTTEGKNADSGVNGPNCDVNETGPELDLNDLGPMMDVTDLFGEHENRPELNEGEMGPEPNEGEKGPELNEGVNETGLNVDENGPDLNEGVNEAGLGNEEGNENLESESEDSALEIHFDGEEVDSDIGGNLDSEVGGNEVNGATTSLNEESLFNEPTVNAETVNAKGAMNDANVQGESVEAETLRGEGSGTAKKGKKKKGGSGKRRGRGRPKKKKATEEPVFEDDIIEHLRRSVNNEGEVGQPSVVGDKGLSDVEEYNSDELVSGSDSDEDGVRNPKFPVFKMLDSMKKYEWLMGTLFMTKVDFQHAVRTFAVENARDLKF